MSAAMRDTFAHEGRQDQEVFDKVMALDGEEFRHVAGRRTLRFYQAGKSYFAKLHYGVGWKEIFKNLLTMRLPILGARTEWNAIRKLDQIGIATTPAVAYGCRGCNPATQQSFLITADLGNIISLETLCADWQQNPPDARFKRKLIVAVAKLAREFHDNGLNHRDFYLCHICLDGDKLQAGEIFLYLIDLHRVGIASFIKSSARMKDIAALYFSAMDAGLSRRDYLRFLRYYRHTSCKETLKKEHVFWRKVSERAKKLYKKFHGKMPSQIR